MLGTVDITYNGNTYKIRFNNYSRIYMGERFGFDPGEAANSIEQLQKKGFGYVLKEVIYAGVMGWALQNDIDPELTRKDIAAYLADASGDDMKNIMDEFNKFFLAVDENKEPEASDKKKSKMKETV